MKKTNLVGVKFDRILLKKPTDRITSFGVGNNFHLKEEELDVHKEEENPREARNSQRTCNVLTKDGSVVFRQTRGGRREGHIRYINLTLSIFKKE